MRTKHDIETQFAQRNSLSDKASFFLVGIGGAGMSGVAKMLKNRGFEVKGTDSTSSAVIDELRSEGIEVWIGHSGDFVTVGDAVVLTDAIDLETSPEVRSARLLGCDLYRRSQVLGWLLEGKKTIAVTGTHGKTTTTGMIGAGMREAGLDPTIVVGAEVPEFGGAIVEGTSEWAVIEACEAYDSLRDLDPHIVVLTNLELDHVDFHESWEALKHSVLSFVGRIPKSEEWKPGDGALVYCGADKGAQEIATAYRDEFGGSTFHYDEHEYHLILGDTHDLPDPALPGLHNLLNANGAACALACLPNVARAAIPGIWAFQGADRRLQVLSDDPLVIDDYAHHPTEILASLQAVRERWLGQSKSEGRLIVVYQPHLYSRTAPLIKEFASALSSADFVVLTDIYPAREAPVPGVSSFRIAELLSKPCRFVPQRHLLPREVAELWRPGDVVVGMGAGNISEFAHAFIEEFEHKNRFPSLQSLSQNTTQVSSESRSLNTQSGLRVAVLYGGDSAEREVSLVSGQAVREALVSKGHEAFLLDVSESLLSRGDVSVLTGPKRPDVCFLAVHGTHAEDGAIQGLLELLHVPYTGSGVQASSIAMDKGLTKQVLERAGLPVPTGVLLRRPSFRDSLLTDSAELSGLLEQGAPGWVVKPNAQGSTVGLTFVDKREDLVAAITNAFQYGDEVLVEEWLRGTEISVPVLGDRPMPVVEIVPASGTYDFESKYTPGATLEICPARISDQQTLLAQDQALLAHKALGCRGCTRTDMIVTPEKISILEVNTLPGMTATSLVPNSAKAEGLSFDDLCDWMVRDALPTKKT